MNTVTVTTTNQVHSGVSKNGKDYHIQTMFLHVPDMPFPLPFKQFVTSIVPAGEYDVPYSLVIDRERLSVTLDFSGLGF